MIKSFLKGVLKKTGYALVKTNNRRIILSRDPFLDQKSLITTNKKPVIFDIGAHHGQTTKMYRTLFKESTIYSFEPFLESYKILLESTRSDSNTHTYNIGFNNFKGKVNLNVNNLTATNSILPTHQDGEKIWGKDLLTTIGKVEINVTTIDEFILEKKIEKIDILKLDTQGTEYSILEGAQNAITEKKIALIYLEIITMPTYEGQRHLDEVLLLLRKGGFILYNFYDYSLTSFGELRQIDAVFLRE